MPSLSDLRAETPREAVVRDVVTVTLMSGQDLADQWSKLDRERQDLLINLGRSPDDDEAEGNEARGSTQRIGDPRLGRLEEIEQEKSTLTDQLADHQGDLTIESRDVGDWLRWCGRHPANEDDPVDLRLTGGQCSAVDLMDDLGTYVKEWDGEPLTDGDWDEKIRIVPGDLQILVRKVADLHSMRYSRAGKSQRPSSSTESGENS